MLKEDEVKYDAKKMPVFSGEEPGKAKRNFKPRIDTKKCEGCMLCVVMCPEGAIKGGENPGIDYNLCKGCLICLRECPHGAISEEKEE